MRNRRRCGSPEGESGAGWAGARGEVLRVSGEHVQPIKHQLIYKEGEEPCLCPTLPPIGASPGSALEPDIVNRAHAELMLFVLRFAVFRTCLKGILYPTLGDFCGAPLSVL